MLGSTPITFPIEWYSSKIPGYAVRASVPNVHGFTAYVVFSSVAARFFTPQVAGIGTTPTSAGVSQVFRIDHDELFNSTVHMQYQFFKNGPWLGFNWRYDSGLVVSGVPDVASALMLTPAEQVTIGFSCNGVVATYSNPITSCSGVGKSTLLTLPQTGTENDDHNPDRVKPRNLFNAGIGTDNLFHKESGPRWTLRFTVENLTNKVALYNFLSTFSGTHFVAPRTYQASLGYAF